MQPSEKPARKAPVPVERLAGKPEVGANRYEDHPLLGGEGKPFGGLLSFPPRPTTDPLIHGESDGIRETERRTFAETAHDPRIDYEPPNPKLVIPRPNLTLELLGAVLAVILFALVVLLMFHNWMVPGPRHPGQPKPSPGVEQKLP
jgi:hypothetical protein